MRDLLLNFYFFEIEQKSICLYLKKYKTYFLLRIESNRIESLCFILRERESYCYCAIKLKPCAHASFKIYIYIYNKNSCSTLFRFIITVTKAVPI